MTVGIYALEINGLFYIGQSELIERRFKDHTRFLKEVKHNNYKMQQAYNVDNNITYHTIQKCLIPELDTLEVFWIKEFNSIEEGLNIVNGGYQAGHSKYSVEQITQAFHLLISLENTYESIQILTGVPVYVLRAIQNKTTHIWLQEAFPEKYNMLMLNRYKRISNNSGYLTRGKVVSLVHKETGIVESVISAHDFCNKYELDLTAIGRVCSGERKSHLGWSKLTAADLNSSKTSADLKVINLTSADLSLHNFGRTTPADLNSSEMSHLSHL